MEFGMPLDLFPPPGLDDEPPFPDFDYAAFLHGNDIDYVAEGSPTSTNNTTLSDDSLQTLTGYLPTIIAPATNSSPRTSTNTGTNTRSGPAAGSIGQSTSLPPKQRVERRGHTKSRRGCFHCKRRRIKCQETRPACGHCIKTGLKCEYPTMPQHVMLQHQPQHQIPLFSLQDMRFFQHFLLQCHGPRHAVGSKNNSTWPHQVPFLSQKHEHLMHAILGYAASDLMQHDASLVAPALVHRHKAVNDIKRALLSVSDMPPKPSSSSSSSSSSSRTTLEQEEEEENNNALMATCLVLTFQSVLLDDGMVGYMTFARGIAIVASHMHARGIKSIFRGGEMEKTKEEGDERPEQQPQYQEPLLVPLIDKSCAGAVAVMAVQTLEPLLRDNNNPIEREYHRMLLDMARQLRVSSWRGAYQALAKHYAWWMTLPHEQFQHVANQNNQAMLLLATHWIALKQIIMMATSTTTVGSQAEEMGIDMGMKRWLSHLNSHVHLEYAEFNSWPRWVEMQMQLGLDRNASFLRK